MQECLDRMNLPDYILEILKCSKGVIVPKIRTDLFELAMGNVANTTYDVEYEPWLWSRCHCNIELLCDR